MSKLYLICDKILNNDKIYNNIISNYLTDREKRHLTLYFITQKSDIHFFMDHINIPSIQISNLLLDKNIYNELYIKIKKILNGLKKFILLYKFKYKKQTIFTDLYLKPLSEYKKQHKIKLLIDDVVYEFVLSDLKKIWIKKIKTSEEMFINPTNLKNPYTNIYIKPHNLYNIYFKMYFSNQCIPIILKLLFECEMSVQNLSILYYPILKEYAIENFIINGHVLDLYDETINMFYEYIEIPNRIYLSTYTPYSVKKKIVRNVKKFLTLYLFAKYSNNNIVKTSSDSKLKDKLNEYISMYPNLRLNAMECIYIYRRPYNRQSSISNEEVDVETLTNDLIQNSIEIMTRQVLEEIQISNDNNIQTQRPRHPPPPPPPQSIEQPSPQIPPSIQQRPPPPPPTISPITEQQPSTETTQNTTPNTTTNTTTTMTRNRNRMLFQNNPFRSRNEIPRTPPTMNFTLFNRRGGRNTRRNNI